MTSKAKYGELIERVEKSVMPMRDQFAMAAMNGEIAAQSEADGVWAQSHFDQLAKRCYQIADAMLAARAADEGEGE